VINVDDPDFQFKAAKLVDNFGVEVIDCYGKIPADLKRKRLGLRTQREQQLMNI